MLEAKHGKIRPFNYPHGQVGRGMGNWRNRKGIALAALVASGVHTDAAENHGQQWKAVPGHENILVDVASVAPMWTSLLGPRDYDTSPPTDLYRVPTETTDVTIKLNGHLFRHYLITCSGFGARSVGSPEVVYFPQRLDEPPTKVMGYVPVGTVEELACPSARLKARSAQPKLKL
jgi:hypothetical protein